MKAYDFDGILIPELNYLYGATQEDLETYRSKLKAIFQPKSLYVIITGRTEDESKQTNQWIKDNLKLAPQIVYYRQSLSQSPEQHKANIINTKNIDIFYESEDQQVQYLRKNTAAKIVHVDELF